jgi:hypothetical protein
VIIVVPIYVVDSLPVTELNSELVVQYRLGVSKGLPIYFVLDYGQIQEGACAELQLLFHARVLSQIYEDSCLGLASTASYSIFSTGL